MKRNKVFKTFQVKPMTPAFPKIRVRLVTSIQVSELKPFCVAWVLIMEKGIGEAASPALPWGTLGFGAVPCPLP